jgi:hypothetical protein
MGDFGAADRSSCVQVSRIPRAEKTALGWTRIIARCRWPFFALCLVIFFSIGHLAGAVQKEEEILRAKEVIAEKFELRGPDGTLAASLSVSRVGQARLVFFDKNRNRRIGIGFDPLGSPGISLHDANGEVRVHLKVDGQTGEPRLNFTDDQLNPSIVITINKGLGPSIVVGSARQSRIRIGVSDEGSPSIQLWDGNSPRISMSVPDGQPIIQLLEANFAVRSTWRVLADGSVSFSLLDRNKQERLVVLTDKDGKPAIRFLDPGGVAVKELKPDLP